MWGVIRSPRSVLSQGTNEEPSVYGLLLGRGKNRKREQRYPQVLASLLGGVGAVLPPCQLGRENRPSLRIPIYSIGEPSGSRRDAVFRAARNGRQCQHDEGGG